MRRALVMTMLLLPMVVNNLGKIPNVQNQIMKKILMLLVWKMVTSGAVLTQNADGRPSA